MRASGAVWWAAVAVVLLVSVWCPSPSPSCMGVSARLSLRDRLSLEHSAWTSTDEHEHEHEHELEHSDDSAVDLSADSNSDSDHYLVDSSNKQFIFNGKNKCPSFTLKKGKAVASIVASVPKEACAATQTKPNGDLSVVSEVKVPTSLLVATSGEAAAAELIKCLWTKPINKTPTKNCRPAPPGQPDRFVCVLTAPIVAGDPPAQEDKKTLKGLKRTSADVVLVFEDTTPTAKAKDKQWKLCSIQTSGEGGGAPAQAQPGQAAAAPADAPAAPQAVDTPADAAAAPAPAADSSQ